MKHRPAAPPPDPRSDRRTPRRRVRPRRQRRRAWGAASCVPPSVGPSPPSALLGLVAVGMVVITPAISAPPEPTGTLVRRERGDGESRCSCTLDVASGTDTALPGTRKYPTEGSTQVSPDGTKVAVRSTNPMDFWRLARRLRPRPHTWTGITHATDAGIGEPSAARPRPTSSQPDLRVDRYRTVRFTPRRLAHAGAGHAPRARPSRRTPSP